jgi:hypothetical protein
VISISKNGELAECSFYRTIAFSNVFANDANYHLIQSERSDYRKFEGRTKGIRTDHSTVQQIEIEIISGRQVSEKQEFLYFCRLEKEFDSI